MINSNVFSNIVKGIGEISEANIIFDTCEKGLICKVMMSLKINSKFLRVYLSRKQYFRDSINKEYYDLIEFLGLPYDFLCEYDVLPYSLQENLLCCNFNGTIKIKEKTINLPVKKIGSKVAFVGQIQEDGFVLCNYISRTNLKVFLKCNIIATPIKYQDEILYLLWLNNNEEPQIYKVFCSNKLKFNKNHIYNFSIGFNEGYRIKNGKIETNTKNKLFVLDTEETSIKLSDSEIKGYIKEWKIRKSN